MKLLNSIKQGFSKIRIFGMILFLILLIGTIAGISYMLQNRNPVAPTVPQAEPQAAHNNAFTYHCSGTGTSPGTGVYATIPTTGGFDIRLISEDDPSSSCPKLTDYTDNWDPTKTTIIRLQCPSPLSQTNPLAVYRSRHKIELVNVPAGTTKTINYQTASNYCPNDPCGQATKGIHGCYEYTKSNPIQSITLTAGTPQYIYVERTSDNGQACGSYQTDVIPVTGGDCTAITNTNISAGVCDTGIVCGNQPTNTPVISPSHTVKPTPSNTPNPYHSPTPTSSPNKCLLSFTIPLQPCGLSCQGNEDCGKNSLGTQLICYENVCLNSQCTGNRTDCVCGPTPTPTNTPTNTPTPGPTNTPGPTSPPPPTRPPYIPPPYIPPPTNPPAVVYVYPTTPLQCGQTSPPSCAGACPPNTLCVPSGNACICAIPAMPSPTPIIIVPSNYPTSTPAPLPTDARPTPKIPVAGNGIGVIGTIITAAAAILLVVGLVL